MIRSLNLFASIDFEPVALVAGGRCHVLGKALTLVHSQQQLFVSTQGRVADGVGKFLEQAGEFGGRDKFVPFQ